MTLTVTPPGGVAADYSKYLAWSGANNQMTISQNFGRQGDTATFPLVDEYETTPHVLVPPLSQIKLRDNILSKTLFAGVVSDPVMQVTAPILNEWSLTCTDYTFYADNALVHGTFYGMTADQIIISLTKQANCGISAATIKNGGFVAPGPQLASVVLNWMTLSAAWRKLATLAGQVTPYGWYVDENRKLHFYDSGTALDSGVTFTTSPLAGGSTTEGHIALDSQNSYEWDGTSIRNRIVVQGATQTITTSRKGKPTDTWRADGTQQSWPLRYTLTGSPLLKINGAVRSVTVASGGSSSTDPWVAEQNDSGAWFLHATNPPNRGTRIQIWYDYQVPVVAQANDHASQANYTGPNGGVMAMYISDSSLSTAPMALARAMRERTEYAFAVERVNFNSTEEFLGWVRAGEVFTYVNRFVPDVQHGNALGIHDKFLVIGNRINFVSGGYRQAQITAVRI
jgi:hypothetical protein